MLAGLSSRKLTVPVTSTTGQAWMSTREAIPTCVSHSRAWRETAETVFEVGVLAHKSVMSKVPSFSLTNPQPGERPASTLKETAQLTVRSIRGAARALEGPMWLTGWIKSVKLTILFSVHSTGG